MKRIPQPYNSLPKSKVWRREILEKYSVLVVLTEYFSSPNFTTAYRKVKFGDEKYSVNTTRTVFIIDSFTSTLYIFGRVPLSLIVHFYLVKMKVPRSIGADIL